MAEEWSKYNNRYPFALLTDEQKATLKAEPQLVFLDAVGVWFPWSNLKDTLWPHLTYRAVRPAPTKPSINWDHVAPWVRYMVKRSFGEAWGLECKPHLEPERWYATTGRMTVLNGFASYDPGTCDWKDSLVSRPGTEDAK